MASKGTGQIGKDIVNHGDEGVRVGVPADYLVLGQGVIDYYIWS